VISGVAPQGLDLAWSYSLAAVCLLAFLGLLYSCAAREQDDHEKKVRRFWYAVLGSDDRVSTSKVQLALWTVALAFALLVIVFHDFTYRRAHSIRVTSSSSAFRRVRRSARRPSHRAR